MVDGRGHYLHKNLLALSLIVLLAAACIPRTAVPVVTYTPSSTTAIVASLAVTPTVTENSAFAETPTAAIKPPDQILYSPNGEFIAEFDNAYSHPAKAKQVIKILDKQGLPLWSIPYQGEISMTIPHPSLSIYGWSSDSQYLYFYYIFGPDGGDMAFWWDGYNLQRINVITGNIQRVIEAEGFVAFAFSPDETQIAYTREQDDPSIIYVRDLASGKEKTAYVIFDSKHYARVGDIYWSPTGDEIAFQTETSDQVVQTIYLNLSTMKQKVIREYRIFTLWFQGWSNDGKLEFFENGNVIHVDPQSNMTIMVGTPTPSH